MATTFLALAAVCVFLLPTLALLYLFIAIWTLQPQSPPSNTPYHARSEELPFLGALGYFTARWDFIQRASARSSTGHFTFRAGPYTLIALRGESGRRLFFDSKALNLGEGYRALLGGQAGDRTGEFLNEEYVSVRLVKLLKGPILKKGLPLLVADLRAMFDGLGKEGVTDPFESIYRMVFQLTMRTVACKEVADSPALSAQVLAHFETVDETGNTALAILYPWLWSPSQIRRTWAGFRIYMIFRRCVDERRRTGRREDDAMQFLIDEGDSVRQMVEFIMGALIAGQINSGVNAAWLITHLSHSPFWLSRVRAEISALADLHCPPYLTATLPLREKLTYIPLEAWESGLPTLDLCLKDVIRLTLNGTAFRRNVSGRDIPIDKEGKEAIPDRAFVVFPPNDAHKNPEIYPEPGKWDPGRYLPERAEDKKEAYAWHGWGVSRHPCLGMRFAKLEMNLITAFWFAYFNSTVCDASGNGPVDRLPDINLNDHSAKRPEERCYLRYAMQEE